MPLTLTMQTDGKGLYEITREVQSAIDGLDVGDGACTVFVQHTSASLTIQENADPSARRDIESWLERSVPEDDPTYTHVDEGPDDMPSHIRAMLTDVSLTIPVASGRLMLGTWQGIFLCEHRRAPHARRVVVVVTPV
ncbi:MAG: secondary thiamine-phosphate synthase enzyme YjbQ [Phycisphaerales bacterium]|nr:secondary thiamine-phosphate synthase enzyme YjbQ [Phycisphaerales bacterium]